VPLVNLKPRAVAMPARVVLAPKVADRFYESKEWRALAAQMKRKAGYMCKCGSGRRLIADHIVERKDGGADLDPGNIEILCGDCHAKKTADARKRRARGQ
jgi:5-methylcytosine-specific restriction enzyme A